MRQLVLLVCSYQAILMRENNHLVPPPPNNLSSFSHIAWLPLCHHLSSSASSFSSHTDKLGEARKRNEWWLVCI